MRRLLKFLHTTAGIGLTGGLAGYMMILYADPGIDSLEAYAVTRQNLAFLSKWLLLPSMILTVVSGLLSLAVHHPFQNAGWVWLKALLSLPIFEATLASIDTKARDAARLATEAADGLRDTALLEELVAREWTAYWTILALCLANVALGIWRPRLMRRPSATPAVSDKP